MHLLEPYVGCTKKLASKDEPSKAFMLTKSSHACSLSRNKSKLGNYVRVAGVYDASMVLRSSCQCRLSNTFLCSEAVKALTSAL